MFQCVRRPLVVSSLFYFIISSFILSCKPQEKTPKGSLYITVSDYYGRPVSKASITGNPKIPETNTDDFGSVLIKELTAGSYEIIASKTNVGSGKNAAQVKADDITNLRVILEAGKFISFAPTVKIEFPVKPANYSINEEVLFKAYVNDGDTPNQEIEVKWESDKDGALHSGIADKDGISTFSTSKLSKATHWIKVSAKDKSGNVGRDSVQVSTLSPQNITLSTPAKKDGQVSLSWNESQDSDFKHYLIYSSSNNCDENSKKLLATVTDKKKISFVDEKPQLIDKACYFIEVETTQGFKRRSNRQEVEFPGGTILSFVPENAEIHPSKPWVFLIHRNSGKIIVFDYEKNSTIGQLETPQVTNSILVADNGFGLNLYVPCSDNSVYIFDANELKLKRTLIAGSPATDIAIGGNGIVFVSISNQWTTPIISMNERNGLLLTSTPTNCYVYGAAKIRKVPNQKELITISTGISPTDMDYLSFDSNGNFVSCQEDTQHGSYPLDGLIFKMSPNGKYLLTSSSGAAYVPDKGMKYLGMISRGALEFSDFAFSEDGNTFYGSTSNRPSIQLGKFPELTRFDEILTRGYPSNVFLKGDKLICISKPTQYASTSAVEVFKKP